MYLLDDRFSTAVAFVEGFNQARDGLPLAGFPKWVAARTLGKEVGFHWAYVIAAAHVPGLLEDGQNIQSVPAELDITLINTMLDLLEEYENLKSDGDA